MAGDDDLTERRLDALAAAYAAEPDHAEGLLVELLGLVERLPASRRLAAARLAGELALERRDPRAAEALIASQLREQPGPVAVEAELRIFLARADIQQLRFDAAREQLQLADSLADDNALVRAMLFAARAQLAHREGELATAETLALAALQGFAGLRWRGPWVQAYATLAIARRELGRRDERARALADGLALSREQRRWGEACNLATGLFDMAIEEGDLARAEAALREAESLAAKESGGDDAPGHAMVQLSRARWLAAQGRHADACQDLRGVLARQRHRLVAYEVALRLDQLADWLLQAGQPQAAMETLAEAQQLRREQFQRGHQRDLTLLRQALEVEQAERERSASERHAQHLERQRAALEQTVLRQRELHEVLIETRKLAGLGELLLTLSKALDGPLREAAHGSAAARERTQPLVEMVSGAAPLSRRQLVGGLQQGLQACVAAQRQVERAIAELLAYKALRDEA